MRENELWVRLKRALGDTYARTWAEQFTLVDLHGRTVAQALSDGVECKAIWRAVWRALELPPRER